MKKAIILLPIVLVLTIALTLSIALMLMNSKMQAQVNESPWKQAIYATNYPKLLELLNSGPGINEIDSEGMRPLDHAINRQDKVIIEILLKNGADSFLINRQGVRPIDDRSTQEVLERLRREAVLRGTAFTYP